VYWYGAEWALYQWVYHEKRIFHVRSSDMLAESESFVYDFTIQEVQKLEYKTQEELDAVKHLFKEMNSHLLCELTQGNRGCFLVADPSKGGHDSHQSHYNMVQEDYNTVKVMVKGRKKLFSKIKDEDIKHMTEDQKDIYKQLQHYYNLELNPKFRA